MLFGLLRIPVLGLVGCHKIVLESDEKALK